MEKYKKLFNENLQQLGECGKVCEQCDERCQCGNYLGEDCPLDEECPEGSQPRSGKCAKQDNSGYLKGKCDKGHVWSDSKQTCVPMAK